MDQFWLENRDAMLYYMSRVLIGVRGTVRDAVTQAPLDATVDVVEIGKSIRTDPTSGTIIGCSSPVPTPCRSKHRVRDPRRSRSRRDRWRSRDP